ncbi:trigger factor [Tyzzerella sp. OttesenSCG-928-J15]|nr:trigger factor [Tyzzerella sp. OttesenSCG-928-J15]
MSSRFEVIEPNKVKITFTIEAEKFEDGVEQAYKRNRGKINIPGFRKGRAPRKIIELNFGKDIFYEDAINIILPDVYEAAVNELNLEVVSRPEIDVEEINDETGVVITAEVYTKPEITVDAANYKGAEYTPVDASVSDDDINEELDKVREQNSRMISVERPIEDGDIAVIDFEGFMDGEAFEGGKGVDHNLTIGSHSFIDNFEEQLIGANVGDDLEVNVNFPEEYHAEHLAGKPAMFKVEIKDIRKKELPELDDDFAQDVSEFDTLDEYKNNIKEKLVEVKEGEAKRKKEDDLITYVISKTEMDIPQVMIENQIDQMVNDFANQIRMQGLPLETYLQYMGQDMNSLREAYKEGAEKQVKGRLVLEAVAKAEGFEVSEEEREAEFARIAESYGMEVEKLKEVLRKEDNEGLDMDIKVKKAVDFINENAKAI